MGKLSFDVSDLSQYLPVDDNEFKGDRTLEEIFSKVWDLEEESGSWNQSLVPSIKSEDKAHRLRLHGDRFYEANKLEMALSLYNMSIMVAPHPIMGKALQSACNDIKEDEIFKLPKVNPETYGGVLKEESKALAEGFASRAKLLFDLDLHEKCLRDISLATEYGCSEVSLGLLENKRKICQEIIDKRVSPSKATNESMENGYYCNGNASKCETKMVPLNGMIRNGLTNGHDLPNVAEENNLSNGAHTNCVTNDETLNIVNSNGIDNTEHTHDELVGSNTTGENVPSTVNNDTIINSNHVTNKTDDKQSLTKNDDSIENNDNNPNNSSRKLTKTDEHSTLRALLTLSQKRIPSLKECNQAAPSLSSAVKVAQTPSSGRGLIADRYIEPGEVVIVDRAYNVSLYKEELSAYCSTCTLLCLTPLPCPGCSEVIFCSEICRQRGLAEDHWIECKILPTLIHLDIPSSYYPHKMLRTLTYGRMNSILTEIKQRKMREISESVLPGCSESGVYSSVSYQAVHNLCTNKAKLSYEFLLKQSKYAYLFTKLLHQSGRFFITSDDEVMIPGSQDLKKTGSLLLSHILMINCNQFTISDQQKSTKPIGSGLFVTASLVNHSCNQSTTRYMCGRDLVLVARRPIQPGEEVTCTYTTDFSNKSLDERKNLLKNYHIDCTCVACKENWPTYDNLPKFRSIDIGLMNIGNGDAYADCLSLKMEDSSCTEKHFHCQENLREDYSKKLDVLLENIVPIDQKMKAGHCISEGDLQTVCSSIEQAHQLTKMPCQSICSLESTLLSCFHALRTS